MLGLVELIGDFFQNRQVLVGIVREPVLLSWLVVVGYELVEFPLKVTVGLCGKQQKVNHFGLLLFAAVLQNLSERNELHVTVSSRDSEHCP